LGEHQIPLPALQRKDLPEDTVNLAKFLLGKRVIRDAPEGRSALRIVETEAYPPGDSAAHAYRRQTPRNRSLFLPRGHAYVYRAYGVAWMLNVASEVQGVGAGVLIRAGAPEEGTLLMASRRGAVPPRDIARGPGRLAQALAIDRLLDGHDLCAPGPLWLADDDREVGEIGVSIRIGLTRAVDRPWRFFVKGSRFVSGPAWLNA
jgi:DNA-3-methyladenine glycosylase